MTLGDVIFLATVLGVCMCSVWAVVALLVRQWRRALRLVFVALVWLTAYIAVMIAVSLLSPQRTLARGQELCFDDICLSVVQARVVDSLGMPPKRSGPVRYWLVTVRMRSAARGATQRNGALDVRLVDSNGQSYQPSTVGQRALSAEDRSAFARGLPWVQQLAPDQTAQREIVFQLPSSVTAPMAEITEGAWISAWVVGDQNSLFAKKVHFLL